LAAFLGAAFFTGAFFAGAFFAVAIIFPFHVIWGFGGTPPYCRRLKIETDKVLFNFNVLIGCFKINFKKK
jgi:hypothetical protein